MGYLDYHGRPYHEECVPHKDEEDYEKTCAACQQNIEGPITVAAGHSYHATCFKCSRCNGVIHDNFDIVDDNLYHPKCIPTDVLPSCKICSKPCDAKSVLIDGVFYHESCLSCAKCMRPLSESKQYVEVEGKLYHHPDCVPGGGWSAPCPRCDKPLSNPACEVDGRVMHNACFVCDKCGKPFESAYAKVGLQYFHENCC